MFKYINKYDKAGDESSSIIYSISMIKFLSKGHFDCDKNRRQSLYAPHTICKLKIF